MPTIWKKVWLDSLTQVESNHLGRIDFDDFKRLMKGQYHPQPPSATTTETTTETTSRSLPHEQEPPQQGEPLSVSLHISSHSHHSTNSSSHHHQPMEGTTMLLPKQPRQGGQSPYLFANMLLGVGIFAAGMAMNGVSLWDWEEV